MTKREEFDKRGDGVENFLTKSGWYARSYQCQETQIKIRELRQQQGK
jgi:hypothetical protein